MARVAKIVFPPESRLSPRLAGADYHDAFEADLKDASLTASQIAYRALSATPPWVEAALKLRNLLIRPFGVKAVRRLGWVGAPAPRLLAPGDSFSIFAVEWVADDELVLGIDDRHLDVRISFLRRRLGGRNTYAVCSLVETHNLVGRLYMLPVDPAHAFIVRSMMRAADI